MLRCAKTGYTVGSHRQRLTTKLLDGHIGEPTGKWGRGWVERQMGLQSDMQCSDLQPTAMVRQGMHT